MSRQWSAAQAGDLISRLRTSSFDGVIFLFSATSGEPDLLPFLSDSRWHLAIPRTSSDGQMEFKLWAPGEVLIAASFGIKEPVEGAITVVPRNGDVAVVPAVAIDSEGYRLGYGGGFYDRWLGEYRACFQFIAGAVFPPFRHPGVLPRESHDIPVDFCLKNSRSV